MDSGHRSKFLRIAWREEAVNHESCQVSEDQWLNAWTWSLVELDIVVYTNIECNN